MSKSTELLEEICGLRPNFESGFIILSHIAYFAGEFFFHWKGTVLCKFPLCHKFVRNLLIIYTSWDVHVLFNFVFSLFALFQFSCYYWCPWLLIHALDVLFPVYSVKGSLATTIYSGTFLAWYILYKAVIFKYGYTHLQNSPSVSPLIFCNRVNV